MQSRSAQCQEIRYVNGYMSCRDSLVSYLPQLCFAPPSHHTIQVLFAVLTLLAISSMYRSTSILPHKHRVRIKAKAIGPVLAGILTAAIGFLAGMSFPVAFTTKIQCGGLEVPSRTAVVAANHSSCSCSNATFARVVEVTRNAVSGSERRLPPGIVVPETDLHLRRIWGSPREDSATRKYLLALAVGYDEKASVNAIIQKFSDNFDIVLFHYDGRTTEWDEFDWSREVAHVSAKKQTKWWFAKRFLHPSTVEPYDYIFLWDEDVGVENFTAEAYLDIVRKHGLEISQPGLDRSKGSTMYAITNRRNDTEMHKNDAGGEHCWDEHKPPCSGFVEVMVPVFSRDAWRCVWHMIQNDLVHAWLLDSNFWRCVDDPAEQIGIVDAQYLVRNSTSTLKSEGEKEKQGGRSEVRARQLEEMDTFNSRITKADKELADRWLSTQH